MIGALLSSLTGLATSVIDGKTQLKLTEAEVRKKQLTGEIDWDIAAINATENSWKDEWITLLFSIPLILAFFKCSRPQATLPLQQGSPTTRKTNKLTSWSHQPQSSAVSCTTPGKYQSQDSKQAQYRPATGTSPKYN